MSPRKRWTVAGIAVVGMLVVSSVAYAATISGTGNPDVLIGTPGSDRIDAFAGDDIVYGQGGADRIDGGKGGDFLVGDGRCAPGTNDPNYCDESDDSGKNDHGRDRDKGHGGHDDQCPPPEEDPFCEEEQRDGNDRIFGGSGFDTISGNGGDDRISAGSGNDTVTGDSGADRIDGGTGTDDLNGGRGPDFIDALDGEADHIVCGPGRDAVLADRRIDDVARDCERVRRR
jgi:Ca2+-binding RTX toxin-like protein